MKWRILVLEDDIDMRDMLTTALQQNPSYEVHQAQLPSWALQVAEKTKLDLIVADVRMGEMDGIECVRRLRARQPGLRSIIITAYAGEDAPARAIGVAAEDYIFKPFKLGRFLTSVSRVLGREQERSLYDRLRGTLRRGFAWLSSPRPAPAPETPGLEEARDRAYTAFYVALSANLLSLSDSVIFWDRLDQLERAAQELRATASAAELTDVAKGYCYLHDFLAAAHHSGQRLHGGTRRDDALDTRELTRLFRRVKNGEISCEQLKVASMLRTIDPRDCPDEVTALYEVIWPQDLEPQS